IGLRGGKATALLKRFLIGESREEILCKATLPEVPFDCETGGGAHFEVQVLAGQDGFLGKLFVESTEEGKGAPLCLRGGPFPIDAVTIAAHWVRADAGWALPVYDTSAPALLRRLRSSESRWGEGDGEENPGPDRIYTVVAPLGNSYRLAAMHIRTRELEHWLNITLWWSPEPDTDFGEDRPEPIKRLGSPWNQYKMCVVVDYEEGDPDPEGGFGGDAPSLAQALEAVHGPYSWCSNPYIDAAPGLFRSNCIACHDHAMSGVHPGELIQDPHRFPEGGRARLRNNQPGDGFWSIEFGDDLASVLRETIAWWDAAER
ncbi:MAG: hypothetical protein RMJ84_13620, partial [Sandaracinaceae bacterium]|nr:hypothetical protein [Sandaracinaceae bacterium]